MLQISGPVWGGGEPQVSVVQEGRVHIFYRGVSIFGGAEDLETLRDAAQRGIDLLTEQAIIDSLEQEHAERMEQEMNR